MTLIDLNIPPWRALSDWAIGLSYILIPFALLRIGIARRVIIHRGIRDPGNRLLLLFSVFILLCGGGHMIDAWYIMHGECAGFTPWKTRWNWGTSSVSLITAGVLFAYGRRYVTLLYKPFDLEHIRDEIKEIRDQLDDEDSSGTPNGG